MTAVDEAAPGVTTRIISADCHVNEPPHVFDNVPDRLKPMVPKMMRGADGGDGWSFDGGPPKRTFGIEATAGRAIGDKKLTGLRFDEILPGNYDGTAHVADMERDGVDVSVVFPNSSIFVYTIPDRELALACLRSYNDWVLGEFQGASPDRIVGLPMLPVDDGMEASVAELERCLGLGARGMFIPGNPARPYHDPYYDPLYARAAEAGVALSFHRTFGGKPSEADWDELVSMNVTAGGTVYRFFAAVRPFTYMVFGGVFARHPELKFVAAEVNFGWLPFWAQTMEQNFEIRSGMDDASVATTKRPTEHLGTNLFVSVLDDHVGFKLVHDHPWLADTGMFSSDYPHSVCLWPNSARIAAELVQGLPEDAARKILAGNAERVYGI
jgi:predicted TIM-barrel fold metal-dependent hydrolase